jgi:hypothetical protein
MNYDVGWLPVAESNLGTIWKQAEDPDQVVFAARLLERLLEEMAGEAGESREPGLRIVFEPPLAIKFWVNEEAKRALVVQVWEYD